jgi:hypothetical protein
MKRPIILFALLLFIIGGCRSNNDQQPSVADANQEETVAHQTKKLLAEMEDLTARRRVLEAKVANLEKELESKSDLFQSEKMKLLIEIQAYKKKIIGLAMRNAELEWHVGSPVFQSRPPTARDTIHGAVVGISDKVNLLMINVGKDDNVKVGYEFFVYRRTSFVGKLVVEKLYSRQSACRVVLVMSKENIMLGDLVYTYVY